MTNKQVALACLLSAVVSAAVTQRFFPQTKTVEVEKDVTHTDVQTVTHTVTRPNGEIDSTITIVDHTQKVDTSSKTVVLAPVPPNWLVSATATTGLKSIEPVYGVNVNRRILGPLFIGGLADTKGNVGVSLGMEF